VKAVTTTRPGCQQLDRSEQLRTTGREQAASSRTVCPPSDDLRRPYSWGSGSDVRAEIIDAVSVPNNDF
jgi:hypothetical protein